MLDKNVSMTKVYCANSDEKSIWFDTGVEMMNFNDTLNYYDRYEFYRFDYLGSYGGLEDVFLVTMIRGLIPGYFDYKVSYADSKCIKFRKTDENVILFYSNCIADRQSITIFRPGELYSAFRKKGLIFTEDFYQIGDELDKSITCTKIKKLRMIYPNGLEL